MFYEVIYEMDGYEFRDVVYADSYVEAAEQIKNAFGEVRIKKVSFIKALT